MRNETEAIIFDLDGTLVDSMWMWKQIDIEYLGRYGIELPPDLQRRIEGLSFNETAYFFKEQFQIPESIPEIQTTWLQMASDKYKHEVTLKPGVREFLDYAKGLGLKLAIASSNSLDLIKDVLNAHGILDFFDALCTCDDVENSKPAPDVYLHTAEKIGVAPEKCLVFEDIIKGICAGKAAGMETIAVDDDYSRDTEKEKRQLADRFIYDYRELIRKYDFVYILGDVYVDHPSFGAAIIRRTLERAGYSVAVIDQPDWKQPLSITKYGEPRLAFLVSAGNMDSMVNHYTVAKKRRSTDAYSPNGKTGCRPDRAVTVYSNLIRQIYKNTPIILGGIEASLRRMAHYDYWSDSVKRSVLLDSGADLISYGMGEKSIVEIADALNSGLKISDITFIAGTVYRSKRYDHLQNPILLPSFEEICSDKTAYAKSFRLQYENTDAFSGKPLVEPYGRQGYVIANPPAKPLTQMEMDDIYDYPYDKNLPDIPAVSEIRFSITSNRGCFGGCNFCALTYHQGRIVQTRSHESIIKEAESYTKDKAFKGYIHDVGGPTADFRHPSCKKQMEKGVCTVRQCLVPSPCKNLDADHEDYIQLLRKLREIPGVKKVFIRSGIRFDYVMADRKDTFLRELVQHHVSGQLRVAPEHVSDKVLRAMGKPEHHIYQEFLKKFDDLNRQYQMKQYAVPYFMSSHPGCTLKDAVELAEYVRDMGFTPEQVQDFYPTPSTVSTCMYYTGLNPFTMEPVYVPKSPHEKAMQRALIQYKNPKNRALVLEALQKAGRTDLIGFGPKCLIRPEKNTAEYKAKNNMHKEMEGKYLRKQSSESAGTSDRRIKGVVSAKEEFQGSKSRKKKTIRNVHKKKSQ